VEVFLEHVLITGGAGFIGQALTKRFLALGWRVTVFDSLLRNAMQYFERTDGTDNLKLIQGDVRDLPSLREAIEDATLVFHLAAIAGVSKYFRIPAEVMEINVIGTYNLLEASKGQKKIKAVLDFSTSEIYGSNCFHASEDGDVKMENIFAKRWTYATSKIASEKFGMAYYWQHGVPFVGIRPFNVYGPGQIGEGVISYFLNNCVRDEPIRITGDGSQCRTYCYIDDFADGIQILLENLEAAIGTSFNIGRPDEMMSVATLAKLALEVSGKNIPIQFVDHQGDDVLVRSPNISKIKALGFKPKTDLREGLSHTYKWYLEHKVSLD
jgi:nucleoside-diphosphate-sugar epimerase